MSTNGALTKATMIINMLPGFIFPLEYYHLFRSSIGAEITLICTLTYIGPQFICVLMTIHRIYIMIDPLDVKTFSNFRVLLYGYFILFLTFISLIIPYFSECRINYSEPEITFASDCAPNRHPITLFQNKYVIILPVVCMIINLSIVAHLKAMRSGFYKKVPFLRDQQNLSAFAATRPMNDDNSRELTMIKQTVAITIYLSLYEFGGLLIRVYPDIYSSIEPETRAVVAFSRTLMAFLINFMVYFVETRSVRRAILSYLNIEEIPQLNRISVSFNIRAF